MWSKSFKFFYRRQENKWHPLGEFFFNDRKPNLFMHHRTEAIDRSVQRLFKKEKITVWELFAWNYI